MATLREQTRCKGRWFIALVLVSLAVLACETIKGSGIETLVGQSVFNRVALRTHEKNKIYSSNRFQGGFFIPAGTECTIKDISRNDIEFTAEGEKYVLVGWRIGFGQVNTRVSFYKFFAENRETIGLDRINPKFHQSIVSGIAEVGMTKEEVLLSLGYPGYIENRGRTTDASRATILAGDKWRYLESQRKKVSLLFEALELTAIVGQLFGISTVKEAQQWTLSTRSTVADTSRFSGCIFSRNPWFSLPTISKCNNLRCS